MSLAQDFRILRRLLLGARYRGDDHAERMEHFYNNQADDYDEFRKRLLPGRAELLAEVELPEDAVVVDLGGGTGANLEHLPSSQHKKIKKWYIVDLSPSLLQIAEQRRQKHGWDYVELVESDATTWQPGEPADLALFSYSLTMIPDWQLALKHAATLLKSDGQIAAVDFTVSHDDPQLGVVKSSYFARKFWPRWFAWDSVYLNPDHLPFLLNNWQKVSLMQATTRLPYLPGSRVPYYCFIGRKNT